MHPRRPDGAGDLQPRARIPRRITILRARQFQQHRRTMARHTPDMADMRQEGRARLNTHDHLKTGLPQQCMAATGNARIGIFQRRDHTRQSGLDQGFGTRRGFSMMGAWLQGDAHHSPPRRRTGQTQGLRFRMRTTTRCRQSAGNDARSLGGWHPDNSPHRRIGPRPAQTPPRHRQSQPHHGDIIR